MRKISRLSLEKLSEQLCTLSDSEACTLFGGAAYFNYSGVYLGDFGDGDDILVVTDEMYRSILERGCFDRHTSGVLESRGLILSDEAKAKIAMHYASDYGFSGVAIDNDTSALMYLPGDGSFDGTVYVNFDKLPTVSSMRSSFSHEQAHVTLDHVSINTGSISEEEKFLKEMDAYKAQINAPEYEATDQGYRQDCALAYYRTARLAGCNIGLDEVYKLCRVDGWY